MSARHAVRRPLAALAVVLTLVVAAVLTGGPASAAGPWYVATTGNNAAACTTAAAPCATIGGVLAKGGFASGDTINVASGTYTGLTTFTKGANVIGSGTVVLDGNALGSTVAVTAVVNVKLTNLTIRNGGLAANSAGGGLRVQAGAVTADDVIITGNRALLGGGVAVYPGTTFAMTRGSIRGNTGTGASQGGGIYAAGRTTFTEVAVRDNTAVSGGGAYVANAGDLGVSGGSISSNTATAAALGQGWGGGVMVAGKTASAAAGILQLTGTTLNDNVAAGGVSALAGLGGAVMNVGTTTISDSSFSGNRATGTASASGYGGAIYHGGTSPAVPELTITDTTIAGGGLTSNAVVGGGIVAASPLTATGLTLSRNVAQLGGGLYTTAPTTLKDSVLTLNRATHGSIGAGGALAAARPTTTGTIAVKLDHTDVTDNVSAVYGGGLSLGFGVTADVVGGSKITGNDAIAGAGVSNAGALTVRDSAVSNNDASYQGGGLYNGSTTASDTPTASLVDSSIDGNTAASGGGGIVTLKGATLTTSGGHINDNSSIGGGGVIVGDGAPATFDGTDLIGNTASTVGGGAVLNSGTTTISRATIAGNKAVRTTGSSGLGGGIYSGSATANASTSLTIRSSTLSGNEAYAAAAVLTYSTGSGATNTASIDNSTVTGNTNSSSIGSIQQNHPLTITGSTITGNTAAGGGSGGLSLAAPTQAGITGTIVSGNSGPECTGTPKDGGRNLTDAGETSCGFSAAKNDVFGAPQLGVLADNGGQTKTLLPGAASPALDKIPAATSTGLTHAVTGNPVTLCGADAKDQRGTDRPQGARCDIGAVEALQVAPTVSGPATADFTLGSAGQSVTFTSTGSPQATLTSTGALPAGVTFVDNHDGTATLSGTPTAGPGGEYAITVKATNEAGSDSRAFTLVLLEAPKLNGPVASTYTVGQAGGPDVFEQSSGFPKATLSASALPSGIGFTSQAGSGTGSIAGTPADGTGGEYDITITGDNGTPPPAKHQFALTVNEAPDLDGPSTSTFTVGTDASSAPFTSTGFPEPELSATGLPAGLTLDGSGSARITGTPADGSGGEYDATVTATNGVGDDATQDVHVVVREAPELTGPSTARLVANSSGEVVFSSDGYPRADITATGSLPTGVSFVDHGNGSASLTGTPAASAVGSYDITVRASNGVAPDSVIHLTLVVAPELVITTTSLADASYKTAYSKPVVATGGLPPYDFSLESGSLPAGLTLGSDGTITGSPTGATGTSTFTVKVTDADNPRHTDTQQLSITVGKGATTLSLEPVLLKVGPSVPLGVSVGVARATLKGGSPLVPIAGQSIVFKANNTAVCTATTDATGLAKCTLSPLGLVLVTLAGGINASYAGSTVWLPSSGTAGILG